jgi:hypothetical protein
MKAVFLFALTISCAFGQSQPPVTSPTDSKGKPPQNQSAPKQNQTEAGTNAISTATANLDGTHEAKTGAQNEPSKWRDPVTSFTGLLVLVGGLQAWIYFRQSRIMEDALGETKISANATKTALELDISVRRNQSIFSIAGEFEKNRP